MDVWRGLQVEPEHDHEADHRAHVDVWIDQIRGCFQAGSSSSEPGCRYLKTGRRLRIVPGVIVRKREDGSLGWREVGRLGPDSSMHPLEAENQRRETAFLAELAKIVREVQFPGVRALHGQKNAADVLALADSPEMQKKGRGMAGAIARHLKLSASQVRRILSKEKKSAHTEKA